METLTLTLHKSKETKNKVVYGTGDGSVIQSVYIVLAGVRQILAEGGKGRKG